ncbi:MAG: sodium/proline symporter [Clostridiales bacterium]|nr:sodium/proline symporter [Clostridiales bacterium]
MTTAQICILLTIVAYLCLMIFVGVHFGKKNAGGSSNEFYLGGRKLGPIVTAMSAEASDMSSWLLMGLPGLAYISGIAEPGWTAIGLAVGTYFNWLIVAKRLRNYSVTVKAVTIPSFFSRRYRDNRNVLSCIAALVVLIFFIPYTASGFKAIGTLFSSLFGVDYHIAMVVGAVVIIVYTVLGGFLAVANNDLIQSIVMSIALVVIVCFGISQAGGWDAVAANATSLDGYLNLFQGHDMATGTASTYSGLSVASTLAWGLGYFGMPHILLRFMAIEDVNKLKLSRRIASIWVTIAMFVAILIGIIGLGVTKAGNVPFLETSAQSETIIIQLANLLSQFGPLLAIVAGVVLAGIMASTMSTADSQLLTAAAGVSQDLMQDFAGIKMTAKQSLTVARITVAGIAVVAAFLAWNPDSSVFRIVSFAWAGFGASFGPVMLFSLFWKRTNKQGALAGMIAGAVMVFVWKYLIAPMGGAWAIYELLPAFLVGCAVIVVVSLATAPPSEEIQKEFESVGK